MKWPQQGKNPNGGSSNHRYEGFLLAVGKGFEENSIFEKQHHIIDLALTILNLLNTKILKEMEGEIII